jgi:hypothetical protein
MRQHVRSLAKADFASPSQHVREGQRIAALDDLANAVANAPRCCDARP